MSVAGNSSRDILGASLCDAINGRGAWLRTPSDNRTCWLHRADKVIGELAQRDWMCVAMDELEALEGDRRATTPGAYRIPSDSAEL